MDKDRWTLLHYAARYGQLETVKFLVERGANINAKNNYRKTPLDIAKEEGHTEIINVLSSARKEGSCTIQSTNSQMKQQLHLS